MWEKKSDIYTWAILKLTFEIIRLYFYSTWEMIGMLVTMPEDQRLSREHNTKSL